MELNVGYRAVHMLLVLPGLLGLAHVAETARSARLMRGMVAGSLLVMWNLPVGRAIDDVFGTFAVIGTGVVLHPLGGFVVGVAFWLLREVIWWWLMIFLLALPIQMLLASRTWAKLWRRAHAA